MQNTANIPMDNLLTTLKVMSVNDRRLIARQLEEQLEREDVADAAALKVQDDENLDAFLSKVSGNRRRRTFKVSIHSGERGSSKVLQPRMAGW